MISTSTDYDAPRVPTVEADSLEELQARRSSADPSIIDVDDNGEAIVLRDELLDEELSVPVVPMQADEFRCTGCFLVRHRHQRAATGANLCVDCS